MLHYQAYRDIAHCSYRVHSTIHAASKYRGYFETSIYVFCAILLLTRLYNEPSLHLCAGHTNPEELCDNKQYCSIYIYGSIAILLVK